MAGLIPGGIGLACFDLLKRGSENNLLGKTIAIFVLMERKYDDEDRQLFN